MPHYRYELVQGSDAWLEARLGIPTASEFDRIVTPKKLEPAAAATKYMHYKLAEWMYGAPLEGFDVGESGWGKRGKDLEPQAVRYYEMERDVETRAVGFVTTDDGTVGASPDRLVGDDGLLELKCPALETHVGYMLDPASLVQEYVLQVEGQMWVCGRDWCDVMSYYPGFPAVIERRSRREKVQEALALHVPAFVATMLVCRDKLTQAYGEILRPYRRGEQAAAAILEQRRAAFDSFMDSPIGGNV